MTSVSPLTPAAIDPATFPSGQCLDGWNMDGYTLACALRHMPERGSVLTIGGGSTGFYAVEFVKRGYAAVVMEPLPQQTLLEALRRCSARLWKCAIARESGVVSFWKNEHPDLSGMALEHWGTQFERETISVPALSYQDALYRMVRETLLDDSPLACLQLDIEGSEPDILPAILYAPPAVLIYEFGGGGEKQAGRYNWSAAHLDQASTAFETLRGCYRGLYIVDGAHKTVWQGAVQDIAPGGYVDMFSDDATFGNVVFW